MKNNQALVLKALYNSDNWRPNLTSISKETKLSVTTVYDITKRIIKKQEIKVKGRFLLEIDIDKVV